MTVDTMIPTLECSPYLARPLRGLDQIIADFARRLAAAPPGSRPAAELARWLEAMTAELVTRRLRQPLSLE